MELAHTVVVNKPLQEVWDYANDRDNLVLWLNDFVRYEHLTGDEAALAVGDTSNHIYKQGGSEFTMLTIVNDFEEIAPGQTRLFASADFIRVGLIMKVAFFFSSTKKMQADHERQINKLKQLIEEN